VNFRLNYLVNRRGQNGSAVRLQRASVSMLLLENVAMRTYDFSPLFKSTVGFDRLFDMLDHARPDWPPYNIERKGDNQYLISMAIAGFGPSEIELVQEGNVLSVTGQKNAGQENREMLHHGLAYRNFKQTSPPPTPR
jgi:molecular chaperone IbpA